jgi:hypothetical protein
MLERRVHVYMVYINRSTTTISKSLNLSPFSTSKMPVSLPISTLKGNWTRLHSTERLRRSSHVVSVIDQTVCIFGGEVQPRQPIDDQIDVLSLQSGIRLTQPCSPLQY